ncbi:MAG: RNA 2',3'-cyclic phosphodiesterase [Candidatus Woesearchaeota archaeon]
MRLFIAIDLPDEVKDYLFNLQNSIRHLKISFVKRENMHSTLKFLGEQQPEKIIERLNMVMFDNFSLELSSINFFPNKKNPRILWVGFKEDKTKKLQKDIDNCLKDIIPLEKKYHAHITLARIRFLDDKIKNSLIEFSKTKIKPLNFNVDHFTLYSSKLTITGPIYEKVKEFK